MSQLGVKCRNNIIKTIICTLINICALLSLGHNYSAQIKPYANEPLLTVVTKYLFEYKARHLFIELFLDCSKFALESLGCILYQNTEVSNFPTLKPGQTKDKDSKKAYIVGC